MRAEGGVRADSHISEEDMQHLHAFSHERKSALMERLAAHEADKVVRLQRGHDFARTLRLLRADGFTLVDIQRNGNSLSSLWFRKSDGVHGRRRSEASMVTLEEQDEGPVTTVFTWWL